MNPPLVHTVAALPIALMSPATDWHRYDHSPLARPDFEVGQDFLKANGAGSLWFFTVARWACIPFSILGGYICFRWARELYGLAAGMFALILWCSCPYVLGHASLFTPDAHAAAIGVAAYYLFWRWFQKGQESQAIVAGIALGVAELAKFTLLVLYPLWIVTWLIYRFRDFGLRNLKGWMCEAEMMLWMILVSVGILNLGYGFEGSFRPIGDCQFRSQLLNGAESCPDVSQKVGNRFSGTWWASLPVPVPANYLQGIDTQKWDFQRRLWSYLGGEWRHGGWWYYYLYALGIKLPLGTLCLILMSVLCGFWSKYRPSWRNEIVLLLPIAAILAIVSSQTGFSIHSRYVLPILPFAYIGCSKVARSIESRQAVVAVGSVLLLCWSVGSSLWCYPHSLSYFNELVGGPKNGHAHLLDSNIAWGQDILYLKSWYDKHPEARPFHLAHYGFVNPQLLGIVFTLPPVAPASRVLRTDMPVETMGPLPGWYAVDVNYLHGTNLAAMDEQGKWQKMSKDGCDLTYFQRFRPVDMAGYSIYIYHITLDEANQVRGELGLKRLTVAGDGPSVAKGD